jgi:hypothetical protein
MAQADHTVPTGFSGSFHPLVTLLTATVISAPVACNAPSLAMARTTGFTLLRSPDLFHPLPNQRLALVGIRYKAGLEPGRASTYAGNGCRYRLPCRILEAAT